MEAKKKFNVVYLDSAIEFLKNLDDKAKLKISTNVSKATYNQDPELFSKLKGHELWEFRTRYAGIQYRLLAFWDSSIGAYVIVTSGFVKKTQKTPIKEIDKAERIKTDYFSNK